MKNNSPIWYAVYVDDPDKRDGPRALFLDEQEALQWGYDVALYHVDVEAVEITNFILKRVDKSNE